MTIISINSVKIIKNYTIVNFKIRKKFLFIHYTTNKSFTYYYSNIEKRYIWLSNAVRIIDDRYQQLENYRENFLK